VREGQRDGGKRDVSCFTIGRLPTRSSLPAPRSSLLKPACDIARDRSEGGDRTGSGRCTLRRGARGRQTVVGGQLPIDLVLGDRRLSTHYPLLPTCYGRRLRVGMAPGDALSFVLSGKDFRPFDKLRVGGG
jgi:hypothetical protein